VRALSAALLLVAVAACSAGSPPAGGPDAGYCESNGYGRPAGGACPKGTCPTSGTAVACCGSECASCEAKGLVSFTASGQCPAGLCPSADWTGSLACCDSCGPLEQDAGASVEAGGPDASGSQDATTGG